MISKDGIAWFSARLPRRWHRCSSQSVDTVGGERIERCACGGLRDSDGVWIEKNSRRSLGEA